MPASLNDQPRPEGTQGSGSRGSSSTAHSEKRSKHRKRKKSSRSEDAKQGAAADDALRSTTAPAPLAEIVGSPAVAAEHPEGSGSRGSSSTVHSEKRAKHRRRKKSSRSEDAKQGAAADDALRSTTAPAPLAEIVGSPTVAAEHPEDTANALVSPDPQPPEEGDQSEAGSTKHPSAFRRVVRRLSLSMPVKQQVPATVGKDGNPAAEPAETSEGCVPTSEAGGRPKRKPSVHYTANALASPDLQPPEECDQFEAGSTKHPSAFRRVVRRLSLSMPVKQQAPATVGKEGKPGVEAAETSEGCMPTSETGGTGRSRRKSSVRFGATTLQAITPTNFTRSSTAEARHECQRATLLAAVATFAAASLGVFVAVYLLHSRKHTMVHCASVECKFAVEDIISLVDPHVSPCGDFHKHVCGRAGDKTFGEADQTSRALKDMLASVERTLLSRRSKNNRKHPGLVQLATTFTYCYAFATSPKPLADATLTDAIANETDILGTTDVVSILRRVLRLSLQRGISTLFAASVVTHLGDIALHVSRGRSFCEKLAQPTDGEVVRELVTRLFERAFASTPKVRRLDASVTVLRLLEFDKILESENSYARDVEMTGDVKATFMTQYVGGDAWLRFVNSLLPLNSKLTESSPLLVFDADGIKSVVDKLRDNIDLGAIYILFHVAMEIGRFYVVPAGEVTFSHLELSNEVVYSRLLNEVFLPASLRRPPILYSGQVPTEFDMGTVGVLMAVQIFHANEPSGSDADDWYDENVGAFGRCMRESKLPSIASQFDELPQNRLLELFALAYSVKVAHRAVRDYYEGLGRDATNFYDVLKKAQRTFFRRFCLLSCGDGGRNESTGSELACLAPVLDMPEFYEAFGCPPPDGVTRGCANLS
ncbi:hypothetical protein HPB50_024927 [Hyalomma asiaticum]|uniref:Uncharacterized protein n=1 Tax=Hyalomma asiaticum TaxID=266040 RepID=A0ACB7RRS4_HYAAI|nr:hypothetical protein HPB50_024927 [Hyalomma asiaticum]